MSVQSRFSYFTRDPFSFPEQYCLIYKYIIDRQNGPNIPCICCDNIFFIKSVEPFNINKIKLKLNELKINVNDFLKKIRNCESSYICKNCKKHIMKGNIPKLASNENLKFPDVPNFITNLSPIEERMVSPFIPFMQIRPLLPYAINPQLSLKGSIVNIHTEINEMIKILPRKFDEMSVIQIKFKRHIDHTSDYMNGTIKPAKVCRALEYLLDTPLYKKNNITINKEFFKSFDNNNDNINFIVNKENENDTKSVNDEQANNDCTYDSDDD